MRAVRVMEDMPMAMGKRDAQPQNTFWLPSDDIARGPGSTFYTRLNRRLAEHDFDRWIEQRCAVFYDETVAGRAARKAGHPPPPS